MKVNLLDTLGNKSSAEAKSADASTNQEPVIETQVEESHQEPVDDKQVKDPDSWSKDSALKEVLKLREENKATRTKYQEQIDKLAADTALKIAAIEESAKTAMQAKKELEELKAKEEDKKRSMEEKLAHREAKLSEIENSYKARMEEQAQKLAEYESKVKQADLEREARMQVYKDRIKEEISKIPETFRDIAEKLVKSANDPHEGWLTLREAMERDVFTDKKVVVNHSVPGANSGARSTNDKIQAANNQQRSSMSPRDLIKQGLEKVQNNAQSGRKGLI